MTETPTTASGKRTFPGLSPLAYQTKADLMALEAVKKVPLMPQLMKTLSGLSVERVAKITNLGCALRLGPNQYPKLYGIVQEASQILDIPCPTVYLKTQDEAEVYVTGLESFSLVIHTAMLDLMEEDEMLAVVAQELNHVKCDSVVYHVMTALVGGISTLLAGAFLGMGTLLTKPVIAALEAWSRKASVSGDRAALLVTQDVDAVIRSLVKLAGVAPGRWAEPVNLAAVLEQGGEYEGNDNDSLYDRGLAMFSSTGQTHPYPVYRAKLIHDWSQTEEYEQILAGNYLTHAKAKEPPPGPPKLAKCAGCNGTLAPAAKFCGRCGTKVSA